VRELRSHPADAMRVSPSTHPVHIGAWGCRTAFGDARTTCAALMAGRRALEPRPVLGRDAGDAVPLALAGGRPWEEAAPPNWARILDDLSSDIPGGPWGAPRRPVFVTSSNFGVGNLYAFQNTQDTAHLPFGTPFQTVDWLRRRSGWGPNVSPLSHACVSAHAGLALAGRALDADIADEALVFTFDFISPFVAGGFSALKILNAGMPAPYADRPTGSIGLGDGAAYAVVRRGPGEFTIGASSFHNEMHHFTANRPDGAGFAACLAPVAAAAGGRRVWVKGHGTGTLEAGRLEAETVGRLFPEAPLVSWKGSLGHTLGSCGLVELAITIEAIRSGSTPGTVGSEAPCFTPAVALQPFPNGHFEGVVLASNAFGGAHAAFLLCHD